MEVSSLLGLGGMIQSYFQTKKSENISLYELKSFIYLQSKKYFACPFRNRSAYDRLFNITPTLCNFTNEELDELKLGIEKIFSESAFTRYCELEAMLTELQEIDFDLEVLFDAIENGEPELYEKIKMALLDDECSEEKTNILNEIQIRFCHPYPYQKREVYNYRQLEHEYNDKKEQIESGIIELLDIMKNEIVHV